MAGEFLMQTRTKSEDEIIRAALIQSAGGVEQYKAAVAAGYDFTAVRQWAADAYAASTGKTPTTVTPATATPADAPSDAIVLNDETSLVESIKTRATEKWEGLPLWVWGLIAAGLLYLALDD